MGDSYHERLTALAGARGLIAPAVDLGVAEQVRGRQEPVRTLVRWISAFKAMDFQEELVEELTARSEGWSRLLVLPTGAGKTAVAAISVLRWLAEKQGTIVWIAPQRELVAQAHAVVGRMWEAGLGPDSLDLVSLPAGAGAIWGTRSRVLFATPQLLLRNSELFRSVRSTSPIAVVVDEAHHFGADAFASVVQPLSGTGRKVLGLSATPRASAPTSRQAIAQVFPDGLLMSERLGKNPVEALRQRGVLSQLIHSDIPIPEAKRSGVFSFASKWRLRDLVVDDDRWNAIIEHICAHGDTDRQIVCCLDRAHGVALACALRARGLEGVAYIDGEYSFSDRAAVLEAFHKGKIRTLVQVQLVMEGVDLPSADSIVLTHPLSSEVESAQAIGRVLRGPKVGGTTVAKVVSPDVDQAWINQTIDLGDLPLTGWKVRWA
jgi:superfamily II DNA or RNA helicase